MRRLLVLLFWRGRTPGPWADRVYLMILGAAILFVYVRLALLLLGVWPLNLPFGIESWTPSMPSFGGGETPAAIAGARPSASATRTAPTAPAQSASPSPSQTASRTQSPSSTPVPDDVAPDEVDTGVEEPLVDDAELVRDEEAGVRFRIPSAYMQPAVWRTEAGALWMTERSARALWFAAERREPTDSVDAAARLWQETVAALVDEERLPPETLVGELARARVFFVESRTQAGLAAEAGDTVDGRKIVRDRSAFVCENALFEIAGSAVREETPGLRKDLARVYRSYAVLGSDGARLSIRRELFLDQGIGITTPSTYVLRPFTGAGYAPESATLMARTIVERVPPGIARVRGWLEVASATAQDEPPSSASAKEIAAFLDGPGSTTGLAFQGELYWGRLVVSERQGVVRAEATFRVVQDGRTWSGRAWWWFAGGRKTALALAAPASSFDWQQYVFAAVADSLRGAGVQTAR